VTDRAPPGFERRWVDEPTEGWHGWRPIPPGRDRLCAYCHVQPAVAELNRQQRLHEGVRDAWWAYCALHLYGRRMIGNRIQYQRLVEVGA
jgi:hypothetical protein